MITPALIASIAIPAVVAIASEILAANPNWKSNSTGQLIINMINAGMGFILDKLQAIVGKK